jgi:hypothetical protein
MTIDKEQMQAQAGVAISALRQSGLVSEQQLQIAAAMSTTAIEVLADFEEKGGFQNLGATAVEGETTTDGPVIAKMTNNGPAKIEKTNTNTTSQNSLTGKAAGNGQLGIFLTQASPQAMTKLLQDVVKANQSEIDQVNEATSPLPDKVKTAIKKDAKAEMMTAVVTSTKSQQRSLGNPIGSAADDFGSLGGKFGNILASISSLVQGTGSFKEVGQAIAEEGSKVTDPTTGAIDYTTNIVEENGNTNIKGAVSKGSSISNFVSAVSALNIRLLAKGFAGRNTNTLKYKFEELTSQEEYELEITNSNRELQNMVIDWLGNAVDETWTPKELHTKLANSIDRSVDAIHSGLQHHYIVYPTGKVYRGRPLDIESGSQNDAAERVGAINVLLIAGSTESKANPAWEEYLSVRSITPDQWGSLDMLVESFLKVKPGGEVLTIQDIDPMKSRPGFSGVTYATKFGKESIYQSIVGSSKLDVKQTVAEIVEEDPPINVQGVPDPSKPKSISELKAEAAKTEVDVSTAAAGITKAKADINKAQSELNSKLGDAAKLGTGLLGNFLSNISSSESLLEGAIKAGQENRQTLIDNGYKYNPKTQEWTK